VSTLIEPGDVVIHKYRPDDLWIASNDDPMWPNDIPWLADEIGLIIQVTPWGRPDDDDHDTFVQVLIPGGTGWIFGKDIFVVKNKENS
jgi:hypothetical protein